MDDTKKMMIFDSWKLIAKGFPDKVLVNVDNNAP